MSDKNNQHKNASSGQVSWIRLLAKLLALVVLMGYLVFSFIRHDDWNVHPPCNQLVVMVMDSAQASFVSRQEVMGILAKSHLNPVGKPEDRIDLHRIETEVEKHQFVLDAQCYITADHVVHVDIRQCLPVMRIMSRTGDNYYIDAKGNRLHNMTFAADVPVATGYISRQYARTVLAPLGSYLTSDSFWNSQVEQFWVADNGQMEMFPRVGNHVISFGQPKDMKKKMERLRTFYTEVLNKVGWNKYKRIDLQYSNQIVCVKAD